MPTRSAKMSSPATPLRLSCAGCNYEAIISPAAPARLLLCWLYWWGSVSLLLWRRSFMVQFTDMRSPNFEPVFGWSRDWIRKDVKYDSCEKLNPLSNEVSSIRVVDRKFYSKYQEGVQRDSIVLCHRLPSTRIFTKINISKKSIENCMKTNSNINPRSIDSFELLYQKLYKNTMRVCEWQHTVTVLLIDPSLDFD